MVAIGASAGGLEAVGLLLRELPPDTGLAFIYAQHLDPHHESLLPDVLRRETPMEVVWAAPGESPQPNQIAVMPAGQILRLVRGRFELSPAGPDRPTLPIDQLFRSIGEDQTTGSIGIILSGLARDGALGIAEIKERGGITMAQDESARQSGMPRAAVGSGAVDLILSPAGMAEELVRLAASSYLTDEGATAFTEPRTNSRPPHLTRIFKLLDEKFRVDFSQYKTTTTSRRIHRRMAMKRIDRLEDYLETLRKDPEELAELHHDLLIRVTGFFRDREVFDYLRDQVLPEMVETARSEKQSIRIWIPGCATGEEVYSMAILLLEIIGRSESRVPIQIFGTDVSERALAIARTGLYPENVVQDISADRLSAWFSKLDGNYRINRQVRDLCVFARQDLTRDPPFSRLDLISCRNVLIYLDRDLQRRVLSVFQYALKPGGTLLLGNSETVGAAGDLFLLVNRRHKLYQKKLLPGRLPVELPLGGSGVLPYDSPQSITRTRAEDSSDLHSLVREGDRIVLHEYSPPGVIVNGDLEILQFRGRTSAFLEPAPGTPSFNLLKMARKGVMAGLRSALTRSRKEDRPVREDGIRVEYDGKEVLVDINVVPFNVVPNERHFLILFSESSAMIEPPQPARLPGTSEDRDITRLKGELQATREYLESIIEDQEAMNEELRSANEEIQSANEELQSTNEELETAKEELQSSNEELTTLNEELENRNAELDRLNNDLVNLLASVDIPIVMLGNDLRIRRFNPAAQRMLNMIPGDVGRPVSDLRSTIELEDLDGLTAEVIETLTVQERDTRDRQGRTFRLRIRPYRTLDNKIDGAVITLISVRSADGAQESG